VDEPFLGRGLVGLNFCIAGAIRLAGEHLVFSLRLMRTPTRCVALRLVRLRGRQ